ncbi:cation diffusion facilitator family transporter [Actinotalea sp. M2MS4P-6]|uniref:cation diffusion facilitator family transporter n=1 Tax=Actinotalea sp. M2MS4P-6 TaxID=2983762 RepID=UPI0021E4B47E|nr:cation diffusion facilitator family transporter [Actinotalea sp. M2MS4P-6]MCV2392951.1 cation diffusion facilitator family transporter [Actinotalea sp. M2MS4P-6]
MGHPHAVHAPHGAAPGSPPADRRYLLGALALILAFMVGEVVVGLVADSLVLLSDAAHMLTDAGSIGLALVAMRLAARPPRGGYTYGLRRAEILSAQANGLTLVLLGAWLAYEAIHRLLEPPDVTGPLVLATALVGVGVNLAATWLLSRANRTSLNVEGAFQHILNDLYAFIATVAAGVVMTWTPFARADSIASLVVVVLMLKAGVSLIRQSGRVLLEAAPEGLDLAEIDDAVLARAGVAEVHDLHVWEITSGMTAASAHVLVSPGQDCHVIGRDVRRFLAETYGIEHATLQLDHQDGAGGCGGAHCS